MDLPIIRTAGDERWDCAGCGVCCRGSLIPLDAADLARLREQRWENDPEFSRKPYLVRESWFGGRSRLAHQPDGSCVFLTAAGRCRIHEKFGAEAKPLTCRMFPLQLVPHEKHAVLTVRRACPTAAAETGRPVADHRSFVQQRLEAGELRVSLPTPPPPIQTHGLNAPSWQRSGRVLATTARIFGDERFPPVRRVVHALVFARLLDQARLGKLADEAFFDLLDLMEQSLPGEAAAYFSQRQSPSRTGRMLFRLNVAEYARLHAHSLPPTGWTARGKLLLAILRMFWGSGKTPSLSEDFATVKFTEIERPLAELSPALLRPEIQKPLERYLALSAATFQYALANRGGWSLTQSIRALGYSFTAGLWLLRWLAVSREPTPTDTAWIVSALDRGQGFASFAGLRHRTLLGVLETLGDLERLAVWYAR
jgi:lysine-N-methylase